VRSYLRVAEESTVKQHNSVHTYHTYVRARVPTHPPTYVHTTHTCVHTYVRTHRKPTSLGVWAPLDGRRLREGMYAAIVCGCRLSGVALCGIWFQTPLVVLLSREVAEIFTSSGGDLHFLCLISKISRFFFANVSDLGFALTQLPHSSSTPRSDLPSGR
jgi:hypothetical protein